MNTATPYKDRRDGLWNKCVVCERLVFKQTLERNFYICLYCNYYSPMPADVRLHYLFDSDSLVDLYPRSTNKKLLDAVELTNLASQSTFPDGDRWLIAAGEGLISSYPAILAIVAPYAVPQQVHFVRLQAAIRAASRKKLPLITIYSSDTLPKRKSDNPGQPELSSIEVTCLTIEMDGLSEAHLPQVTVLTDPDPTVGFSTKFPLGDLVLAEQSPVCQRGFAAPLDSAHGVASQQASLPGYALTDAIIDRRVQRQDLPATLGKLLAFFA